MMTYGTDAIAAERRRQIERWGDEHDAFHDDHELLDAARCYLSVLTLQREWRKLPSDIHVQMADTPVLPWWPWEEADWKPSADPIRNLEKAGALIAAEIDRLKLKQAGDRTEIST